MSTDDDRGKKKLGVGYLPPPPGPRPPLPPSGGWIKSGGYVGPSNPKPSAPQQVPDMQAKNQPADTQRDVGKAMDNLEERMFIAESDIKAVWPLLNRFAELQTSMMNQIRINPYAFSFQCGAMKQGTAGGNDPADCDWPFCGCDPHANKVLAAIDESGLKIVPDAPKPRVLSKEEIDEMLGISVPPECNTESGSEIPDDEREAVAVLVKYAFAIAATEIERWLCEDRRDTEWKEEELMVLQRVKNRFLDQSGANN